MASKADIEIKIIGAGSSKFGLWLLGFVARMFHINLEVRPTPRALDGAECVCENHTDNDGWRCNVCGLLSPHRQ
jgi:hypothetical protein